MDMSIIYWIVGLLLGGSAVAVKYQRKIKALIDIVKNFMGLIDMVKATRETIEDALKDHILTKEELENICADLYKIEEKAKAIYDDYKVLTGEE